MKLLLARHGNTFEKDEAPYIVGCNEDLPLTAEGEMQAMRLAAWLRNQALVPGEIICGPLQRTTRMAGLIGKELALPPARIDARLAELDYGAWSGLSTDQVGRKFGTAEVDAWDSQGTMPENRGWKPSSGEVIRNVHAIAQSALSLGTSGAVLVITSNGVLRFFSRLVDGLFEDLAARRELKVGTGNLCCLEHDGAKWVQGFWNRRP